LEGLTKVEPENFKNLSLAIKLLNPNATLFLIDVHKRIANIAFEFSKKGKTLNSKGYLKVNWNIFKYRYAITGADLWTTVLDGSVVAPDVRALKDLVNLPGGKESIDIEHFDNMNYEKINSNFKDIESKIDNKTLLYKTNKINPIELGNFIGEYFHAIADFYSHSNYIELYESIYGKTKFSSIPTFKEVNLNPKFLKFKNKIKIELKTGEYPGDGSGSHKDLNHDLGAGSLFDFLDEVADKEVNWNSKAAEATAIKATIYYNDIIESIIK
jgi:hypothetical protein